MPGAKVKAAPVCIFEPPLVVVIVKLPAMIWKLLLVLVPTVTLTLEPWIVEFCSVPGIEMPREASSVKFWTLSPSITPAPERETMLLVVQALRQLVKAQPVGGPAGTLLLNARTYW